MIPVSSEKLHILQQRAQLTALLRAFFTTHNYWEVETPVIMRECIHDAWIDLFVTDFHSNPANWRESGERLYLQSSPEFAMKQLLAAGANKIFQLCHVFRNGEAGTRHQPEFTMLEWYCCQSTLTVQMTFIEQLIQHLFQFLHGPNLKLPPFLSVTYEEAFAQAGIEQVLSLSTLQLQQIASDHQLVPPPGLDLDDRDGWLNYLLAELIEPQLGQTIPTFLWGYPVSQAALARTAVIAANRPEVALRFELYWQGVELCNGYDELTDPHIYRAREIQQHQLRQIAGLRPLPENAKLIHILEQDMPASCGVALGWDRLVMLLLQKTSVADVIAVPWNEC